MTNRVLTFFLWVIFRSCFAQRTRQTAPVCIGTAGVYKCYQMSSNMINATDFMPFQSTCRNIIQKMGIYNASARLPCSAAGNSMIYGQYFDPNYCPIRPLGVPSCASVIDELWNNLDCFWMFQCYVGTAYNFPARIVHRCTTRPITYTSPTVGFAIHDSTGTSICNKGPAGGSRYCQSTGGTGAGWNIFWQMCKPFSATNIANMHYAINSTSVDLTNTLDPASLSMSIPATGVIHNFSHPTAWWNMPNFWIDIACLKATTTPASVTITVFFWWKNTATNNTHYDTVPIKLTKICAGAQTSAVGTLSPGDVQSLQANNEIKVVISNTSVVGQTIDNFYVSALNFSQVRLVTAVLGHLSPIHPEGIFISPANATFNSSIEVRFDTLAQWGKYEPNFRVVSGKSLASTDWRFEDVPTWTKPLVYRFWIKDTSRQVFFLVKVPPAPYSAEAKILLNDWQLVMVIVACLVVFGTVGYMTRGSQYDVRKTEYNAIAVVRDLHSNKDN